MIINCPVYLEIEGKFTPQEGREITLITRKKLNEFIRKTSKGNFVLETDIGRFRVTVLTEDQAINRFGSTSKLKASQPKPVGQRTGDFKVSDQ